LFNLASLVNNTAEKHIDEHGKASWGKSSATDVAFLRFGIRHNIDYKSLRKQNELI